MAGPGNSRFLTYESSVLGIRIQYPSSWSFSEDKGEDNIITGVTFQSMPDLTTISVSPVFWTGPENTPLDEMANTLFEHYKEVDPSTMLVGQIPSPTINTPNIQSVLFQFTNQQQGVAIDNAEYLIKHNNDIFNVQYLSQPETYAIQYPTFTAMLDTLEFIGSPSKNF